MFLFMNNSNYMSNRNHFKDIGTFLFKKIVNVQLSKLSNSEEINKNSVRS